MRHRVIHLHPDAPRPPGTGAACNGCGICCAWAPCPLGMWLSRRLHGACAALTWDDHQARYRCGALLAPARHLPWLPAGLARRLVHRLIAAARGCDADLSTDGGPVPPAAT